MTHELGSGICGIATIITNIRKVIAPAIDTAYHLQDSEGDVNLKYVPSSPDGLW